MDPIDPERLSAPATEVAPALLGARLLSLVGGRAVGGRIVEVEAYLGAEDPASHAAVRAGKTTRNAAMFGRAGTSYVYFVYGMHWCFNVVTGAPGDPQAVLIRALEVDVGREEAIRRRGGDRAIASGPARLCEALGIDATLNGHDLARPPLFLLNGTLGPRERVATSGRIGVRAGGALPYRFFLERDPEHSPANASTLSTTAAP